MSKRKAHSKRKQLGKQATTMLATSNPIPGRFYAIDTSWYDEGGMATINLYSGKRKPAVNDGYGWLGEPIILDEIFPGSMVYYLGEEEVKELGGFYRKVGYKDSFGFLRNGGVIFYDLGDISSL